MATREEEYLRRMKALGYEPSLAEMDDEDIEWELARMAGSREAERRDFPPLNGRYRPVDPGLAARILRQMRAMPAQEIPPAMPGDHYSSSDMSFSRQ